MRRRRALERNLTCRMACAPRPHTEHFTARACAFLLDFYAEQETIILHDREEHSHAGVGSYQTRRQIHYGN